MQSELTRAGSGAAHIFQINASDGGVPKLALQQAHASSLGLSGDRQSNPDVHGGPERAVCLYSLECILELQKEGHPIYPGAIGENLTLAGLDWPRITPGTRLRLGIQVLVEVTGYAAPCSTIRPAFKDQNSNRVSHKLHPGWSRVYVRVLVEGSLQTGDPVFITN